MDSEPAGGWDRLESGSDLKGLGIKTSAVRHNQACRLANNESKLLSLPIGESPSGKAAGFGLVIRRFDPSLPNQNMDV